MSLYMCLDLPALEEFGENTSDSLSGDVIKQTRDLTISVYTSKADHPEDFDLGKLRVYKFLNNSSTLLKLLPPTENAFDLHLRREKEKREKTVPVQRRQFHAT